VASFIRHLQETRAAGVEERLDVVQGRLGRRFVDGGDDAVTPVRQRGQYQFEDQQSALNTMVSTMSATINVYNDQACQAARRLIPSTPRPCSLGPVLTTPFYGTSVSQALQPPLRGRKLWSDRAHARLTMPIAPTHTECPKWVGTAPTRWTSPQLVAQ
jgi:hypothetical protein